MVNLSRFLSQFIRKNDNQQDNIDTWIVRKEIHDISFKIVHSEIMNVLYQIIRFLRHEKNNGYVIPFSLISCASYLYYSTFSRNVYEFISSKRNVHEGN